MISDDIKRLYYYNRQYLGFKDFRDEQKYHIDMRRRHNIAHHTWGIVVGLELERKETFQGSGVYETFVKPGMAVDGFGREIVVFSPEPLDTIKIGDQLAGNTLPARLKVWIAYDVEKVTPPASGYEVCNAGDQFMRFRETYKLIYKDAPGFKGRNPDDLQTWPQASEELQDDPVATPWPVYLGTIVWDTDLQNPSQKVITDIEFVDSRDDKRRHYVGANIPGTLTLGPSGNEIIRGDDPGTKNPITGQPNNGLLIQSAQTVEINIDSNDKPSGMFVVTKGSNRTELLRVQEDGKVGIGTADPKFALDAPSGWFRFGPGGDGGRIFAEYGSAPDPLAPTLKLSDYDDPPRIQFQQMGTGDETNPQYKTWIGMAKGKSNDLAIMNGNVGIGTNNPSAKLHVNGLLKADNFYADSDGRNWGNTLVGLDAGKNITNGDFNTLIGRDAGNGITSGSGNVFIGHAAGFGKNVSNKLYITNTSDDPPLIYGDFQSGNVGIGTKSPDTKLHIFGGSDASLSNGSGYLVVGSVAGKNVVMDNNEIIARNNGAKSTLHFQAEGGDLMIHNNKADSTKVIVKDSGNVGIGTTSPEAELHVIGNLLGAAKGPAGEAFRIAVGKTSPGNTNWIQYGQNGIYVDIDTSGAGFSSTPFYFTSLGGNSRHWTTQGATSIYSPTATNFRVYIYKQGLTVSEANDNRWHIVWIGIGN